ncbi:response regulator [Desnuesiella massiliensis]|uniref:response regulator n=1 Tax=Desnuesiella massiliensis TaxID=1650662 RepID=UPI0006E3E3A0|nr:response regulator [Desnuesiella massiliensis]
MKNIIILDNKPYIRYRVRDIATKNDILVHEVSNSSQLYTKLNELKNEVDLLIVEINLKDEDGLEIMRNLKKKNLNIPFMVLTSLNTRDAFIRAVKEGAIDYFLKPFDDRIFLDRVTRHAEGDNSIESSKAIQKDIKELPFNEYFEEEINKARNGAYKLSVIMTIFFKSLKDVTIDLQNDNDNMVVTDYMYNKLKGAMPEGGRFCKYGSRTFLGVYPFCDKEQMDKFNKDIMLKINHLKDIDSVATNYFFDSVTVTFPDDGNNAEEILDKITEKMKENIKQKQIKSDNQAESDQKSKARRRA